MVRKLLLAIGHATVLVVVTTLSLPTAQAQFGTERDAKALLDKAVVALKQNKEKALDMFKTGREAHVLYEGRRSELRRRLLQGLKRP